MKNKMTVYTVYMDDGMDCFKVTVPAFSKEDAIKYVSGNGEVIAIRENDLVQDIDLSRLSDTLANNGWELTEINVITRALRTVGLDR